MRLVTWNLCGGFGRKSEHVEQLQPDIAILQEVRETCLHRSKLSLRSAWIGNEGQPGLAAIAYGDWKITPAPIAVGETWFLPLVATNGITTVQIVAVLVSARKRYGVAALSAIEQLGDFIRSAPTLLAGDFNNSVVFDARRACGKRFSDVLAALSAYELSSAWHSFTGETHGKESVATLYWKWKADLRFHIDYVFHPPSMPVAAVTIGTFEQSTGSGISDHAPVVVDFAV